MKTLNYKGFTIKIEQDDDSQNPREWDNLGTMVCWHNGYNLGDKHDFDSPSDFRDEINKDNAIILPLFLYDHSGITMSTSSFSCPWDSGQVGYIYVTLKDVRKEYGVKRITKAIRQKATNLLISEVETFDQYLTGDVYGYMVEETGDSCWGYFGQEGIEQAISEAKDGIDYEIDKRKQDHYKKLKTWIKNRVPFENRKALML